VNDQEDLPLSTLNAVRRARAELYAVFEPHRPELYQHCHRLTGNRWDAEDLVQETLTRAFARAAQTHRAIERPIAWLVRIATNAHLDALRRITPEPADLPDLPDLEDTAAVDPLEVRDALDEVRRLLPPQEQACFILKEAFDMPLKQIADMLSTSEGAVKAALHRGRAKLAESDRRAARARRAHPDPAVVDRLAAAFCDYDLDRLTELLLPDATSEVVGMVDEVGRDDVRAGSLHHTLFIETHVRYRAEVRVLDDEPLVLLWERPADGPGPEALGDVIRVEVTEGAVARLRWYFFCPEVLTDVAAELRIPVRTHGYHY
jgi:RNA polymerase sigma-70 factor, ECF subfamily